MFLLLCKLQNVKQKTTKLQTLLYQTGIYSIAAEARSGRGKGGSESMRFYEWMIVEITAATFRLWDFSHD